MIICQSKFFTLNYYFHVTVSSSGITAGALFFWTSPAIPLLISTHGVTPKEASYLTSIPCLAFIISSPLHSVLLHQFGPKLILTFLSLLEILIWSIMVFTNEIYVLYFTRILCGVCVSGFLIIAPVYVAEISTPKVRSLWGNLLALSLCMGQLSVNGIGNYCTLTITAIVFLVVQAIISPLHLYMPNSPYYLMMNKQPDEAYKTLEYLKGGKDVKEEYSDMEQHISDCEYYTMNLQILFTGINRRALFICAFVKVVQEFSGITIIGLYTQSIFQEVGEDFNKGQSAMLYTGTLTFCTLVGLIIKHNIGTRPAMVVSAFGCSIALFIEAVYFYFRATQEYLRFSWVPIFGLIIYVVFYSLGLVFVPMIIIGELFTVDVKPTAACVINMLYIFLVMVTSEFFYIFLTSSAIYIPFAVFGMCSLAGALTSYFVIPETNKKTLKQIQEELESSSYRK